MKIRWISVLAALLGATHVLADTEAPAIVSASIAPGSVDVTSGDGSITVTMEITDNESGVKSGNLFLYDHIGRFVNSIYFDHSQRTAGDALDGTYVMVMSVPQYAIPGTWRVDALVDDVALKRNNSGPGQGNTPFPIPAAMTFTLTNAGTFDVEEPFLVSHSSTPEEVNVENGPAFITFTLDCGDALSGINYGLIYPHDPNGDINYDLIKYFSVEDRASGSDQSGVYEVEFEMPEDSQDGEWTFEIFLNDKVGNSGYSPAGSVVVTAGPISPVGPSKSFLAQAVDAVHLPFSTGGNGWVMHWEETYDGVDSAKSLPVADGEEALLQTTVTGPGTISFQWQVDSENSSDFLSVWVDGVKGQEISGFVDWTQVSITLTPGEHTVSWRYKKDGTGSNGQDRGCVDQVRFEAASDSSLPQLQDLRINPRSVDLIDGPEDAYFEIEVTDDFNGLAEGRLELFDPSGNAQVSTTFDGSTPDQGDSKAGRYNVILQVPDNVEFGLWRAELTLTEAGTNLTRNYGPTGEAFPVKVIEYFYAGDSNTPDTQEPVVRAIEVTPGTVDVSTGDATATVTLQVTDFIAGFSVGNLSVNNPDGEWTGSWSFDSADRISGDEFNGIYQVQVSVPQYGTPGEWLIGCYVSDNDFNDHEYPSDLDFPVDVDETFAVTNTGTIDMEMPEVTSIAVTPGEINTAGGPDQIEVTISLDDDLSGRLRAGVYFFNPADEFQNDMYLELDATNRISGDDLTGTYRFTKTLPQGSAVGQWIIRVFVRDKTGKARYYGQGAAPYPSGDGYFTVGGSALSLYDAFVAANALVGNDALPNADPDQDGRNNATELMLGSLPGNAASSGSGLTVITRDATHLHYDFTIDPALTVTTAGDFLELGNGSGGAPMKLTGQTQAGLAGPWTNVGPVLVSGSTYRVSLPLAGGPKGFVRLFFETP